LGASEDLSQAGHIASVPPPQSLNTPARHRLMREIRRKVLALFPIHAPKRRSSAPV
jgi:hypothetical protein